MAKKIDREAYRESLQEETKHSYDTKDSSGLFKSIFVDNLPDGAREWKVSEGEHILDVIPFIASDFLFKSSLQPKIQDKKGKNIAYKVEVYVHDKVGPTQSSETCPAMVFEDPCPICELRQLLFDKEKLTAHEQTILDKNRPIRRVAYNVYCRDSNKEMEKGVQMWLVAHFFFENHVAELSQLPHGGGYLAWSDPDEGKSVMFRRKGTGKDNTSYLGHRFLDRDPLDDELLLGAHPLDSLIRVLPYERLFRQFFQVEHTGQPVTLSLMGGVPAEEEASTLPDEPAPTTGEEEPPVEEKEEPTAEETTQPAGDGQCPSDHVFGVDLEKFPADCGSCAKWDDCADESDRLKREGGDTKPKLEM